MDHKFRIGGIPPCRLRVAMREPQPLRDEGVQVRRYGDAVQRLSDHEILKGFKMNVKDIPARKGHLCGIDRF